MSLTQSYPESHKYFKERWPMAAVQRGAKIESNTKKLYAGDGHLNGLGSGPAACLSTSVGALRT